MRTVLQLLPVALLALLPTGSHGDPAKFFEDSVQPLLQKHCTECHNPDRRKADLDLTTASGILAGGESGNIFKSGDPEDSLIYELVHKGEMPKKGDPLSSGEQQTIHNWIKAGATFRAKPGERPLHQHDIIPIVLLRCNSCHGPQLQRGSLVMNSKAAMLKGGENGPAIIPGKPDASLAIQRIEQQLCPPKGQLLKYFVKRPTEEETTKLRNWIAAGAPEEDIKPDVASLESDPLISDEDRQHWAFQPVGKVAIPKGVRHANPIDAFIGRGLETKGLTFSPSASRLQLIRRAFLDLTGIPPALDELRRWRDDSSAEWYDAMIGTLLDSPRYGERWGRYWLDLAGYADSEGGTSADPLRRVAWKYRDYVINSFNRDKPYDRFLLEQIAGDELEDFDKASTITDELVENLVATGFLRMGIDQTGSRTMNFVSERMGVIADAIDVLGSGVMGLTLACARCHSHKYDPIPHRDYYRLKATLKGAFDEHDWLSFKKRSLQLGTAAQRERYKKVNPTLLSQIKKLAAAQKQAEAALRLETLRLHYPAMSESDRKESLVALRKADNQRSLKQRGLVEKLLVAELMPDSRQPAAVLQSRENIKSSKHVIFGLHEKLAPSLEIRALWDRGRPSPTYILRRGEHDKSGRLVGPGVPAVLTDGRTPFKVKPPFPNGTGKSGRRLAFAKWLTKPDHPLTARVMVNRIWHHHFGAGLVSTLENFGVKGERPTHPELLDWIAGEFMRHGWSMKAMHRLIMTSRTYRQSSRTTEKQLRQDPLNHQVSRMPLRRMDAEALRDSLLFVSGRLDPKAGGPPDTVSVDREGLVSINPTGSGNWRRSIYAQYRRTEIPSMMGIFDYPEMGPNCISRSVSIISPQSLMLLNNSRIRELATSFAERVRAAAGSNAKPNELVKSVYQLAINRPPNDAERMIGTATLAKLKNAWDDDSQAALETYCHTVLNSAAFIYVD
jgi:cytochrome c553